MNFTTSSAEDTIALGKKIGALLEPGAVVAMEGGLGAGKTTISKGIALGLGVEEEVTSPTFTLVSEYEGRIPLYHIDAYRLDDAEGLYSIGAEEMMGGRGACLIEWSENVRAALPSSAIVLRIRLNDDGTRDIAIENWPYGEIA